MSSPARLIPPLSSRAPRIRPIDRPNQPSLVEQVLQRLSESIAVGSLAPGQLLIVDQLASALGVSKTPVREAFRTLLRDGLIHDTETGLRVAPLDSAYVREVYAVRSALESLAVEVIAPALTPADLDELQIAARSARPPDQEFHDVLRSKCPWPYLRSLIDTIQVHRERVRMLEVRESAESHEAGYREHLLILKALKRRDGKLAHALMQAHLNRLLEEVSQFADQTGDPPVVHNTQTDDNDASAVAARFAAIVEALSSVEGVTLGSGRRGFGSGTLCVDGKIFAMPRPDGLALKLPAARVAELVASRDGLPFDAGKGKPMREWVVLGGRLTDERWLQLATAALAFVAAGSTTTKLSRGTHG